jgi:replication-associated recombination protein RarA
MIVAKQVRAKPARYDKTGRTTYDISAFIKSIAVATQMPLFII